MNLLTILAIVLSVGVVMLESVGAVDAQYGDALRFAEWGFTVLFTIEYVVRLLCVRRPRAYALSFFGIVDLVAVAPTYLSLLLPGAQTLVVVRALRLLRVFRILKLVHYLDEMQVLGRALRARGESGFRRARAGRGVVTCMLPLPRPARARRKSLSPRACRARDRDMHVEAASPC